MPRTYFVYIMSNRWRTIYVGVTNNIVRRVHQHRTGSVAGFTQRYSIDRLVYVESTHDVRAAIEREKQIKSWSRKRKIALIESINAGWRDLAHDWFDDATTVPYVPV